MFTICVAQRYCQCKAFKILWQQGSSLSFGKDLFCSIHVCVHFKDLKVCIIWRNCWWCNWNCLTASKHQIWSLSDASCLSVSHQGHPEWAQFSFISTVFSSICCLIVAWLTFPTTPPIVQSCHLQLGSAKPDFALSKTCADVQMQPQPSS